MTSEQINEIAAALAKAQGAMENAKFNRVNPHFKNRYADLAAIIDAVKKPLADNGIGYTQTTETDIDAEGNFTFMLVTKLMHTSGQWISSVYPLPFVPDKPQVLGTALTYGRRYELATICGIAAEEDTDAEGVEEEIRKANKQPPPPKADVMKAAKVERGPPDFIQTRKPDRISSGPLPPHDTDTGEIVEPENIQAAAREAATFGIENLRQYYKARSKAERAEIDKILPQLTDAAEAADAGLVGEGS